MASTSPRYRALDSLRPVSVHFDFLQLRNATSMSRCPRCGASFECAMADAAASGPCWCTRLPPLRSCTPLSCSPGDADDADQVDGMKSRCFCPSCLRALIEAQEAHRGG